jgi:cytochrome c-type biogenesis protein CcmH/NrfG
VLEEAIQLNPGDALYYAHLGWVTFNVNQKSQQHVTDAVNFLKRALQEQENCPIAYQYLGQIALARGQPAEAKKWWQRCLEWEPNNIEASRGIRMVNSREDKDRQNKSGLLSKFLNKK